MKRLLFLSIGNAIFVFYGFSQTHHKTILTKTEKHFIPEGITINPADGNIFVSSIALKKIVVVNSSGAHKDFIASGQHGFLEGLGVKIDSGKQWLWCVSNQRQGKLYTSQIHAFDLKSGALKQEYSIRDTVPHLFNDLIIHPNGKIYITDTFASSIYEVDVARQKLKLFIKDTLLARANGITHSPVGKVYISTRDGLVQADLVSKKILPVTYRDFRKALWLDGISFWNNSIMGVADNMIIQYGLDKEGNELVTEKVVDEGNAVFRDPTTAAVFSNKLYVVANSYLAAYNKNQESTKGIENELGSVIVLVYDLDDLN